MAGKHTRVSFKKYHPSRKLELLELVHSDVNSFSEALYFVTFIDDCSKKLWVYALKTKDQVLEKFKQFQALVERQSGKKVKCIHSNNSGEYYEPFDLNDLAERMNKTLIERVRCMLFEARLLKHFCGKTLYTAVHVINLSFTIALNAEVPNKIWFEKDAKYDHLQDEYGYKLYDSIEKKLVRSCNVQFMEDQTIEDIDKVKKTTPEKDNIRMSVHDLDTIGNNVQNGKQHDYVGDQQLGDSFAMKDMGATKHILGIRIIRDRQAKKLWLSQEYYVKKISYENTKAVSTPLAPHFKPSSRHSLSNEAKKTNMNRVPYASTVGSLMYAMMCTRLDIVHVVDIVNRFLSNPGYIDSNMTGDIDSKKTTFDYLIKFVGGLWLGNLNYRSCVALSTIKAEFIVITEACKELFWVKKFLQELGFVQDKYLLLYDSQSATHLGKNSTFHSRSKHIGIRDALDAKLLELVKVHIDDNGANMITKTLPRGKFEVCCEIVGMAITPTYYFL
ncbi:hypothetical protein CR513_37293, partial [Mucuna pruriens]